MKSKDFKKQDITRKSDRMFKPVVGLITAAAFLVNTLIYDTGLAAHAGTVYDQISEVSSGHDSHSPGSIPLAGTFSLPPSLGEIKSRQHFPDSPYTVFHIQDAHANYDCQKSIAGIIAHIEREYGIRTVNLEGGSGEYDLSVFTDISDVGVRRRVADYFVREGILSGAEYFHVNEPGRSYLWGIEDVDLYISNLEVYRGSLRYGDSIDKGLKSLSTRLDSIKKAVYSPVLYEIDRRFSDYRSGVIGLREHLLFLSRTAREQGLEIKQYPNVYLLSRALELEGDIDFRKANAQRSMLIDELLRLIPISLLESLTEKTVEFRSGGISQLEFYDFLSVMARRAGLPLSDFPELEKFMVYISVYDAVDKSAVIAEISAFEEAVKECFYENDAQKELAGHSKNMTILENMFAIKLTRDDYEYYKANEDDFSADNFTAFIEREGARGLMETRLAPQTADLDARRAEISRFYEYSFKRDDVFLNNIRFESSGENDNRKYAMLVTGGFHSDNLYELFREKRISYVSIIPDFRSCEEHENPYFRLLSGYDTGILSSLTDTLGTRGSALALYSFFCETSFVVNGLEKIDAVRTWVKLAEAVFSGSYGKDEAAIEIEIPGIDFVYTVERSGLDKNELSPESLVLSIDGVDVLVSFTERKTPGYEERDLPPMSTAGFAPLRDLGGIAIIGTAGLSILTGALLVPFLGWWAVLPAALPLGIFLGSYAYVFDRSAKVKDSGRDELERFIEILPDVPVEFNDPSYGGALRTVDLVSEDEGSMRFVFSGGENIEKSEFTITYVEIEDIGSALRSKIPPGQVMLLRETPSMDMLRELSSELRFEIGISVLENGQALLSVGEEYGVGSDLIDFLSLSEMGLTKLFLHNHPFKDSPSFAGPEGMSPRLISDMLDLRPSFGDIQESMESGNVVMGREGLVVYRLHGSLPSDHRRHLAGMTLFGEEMLLGDRYIYGLLQGRIDSMVANAIREAPEADMRDILTHVHELFGIYIDIIRWDETEGKSLDRVVRESDDKLEDRAKRDKHQDIIGNILNMDAPSPDPEEYKNAKQDLEILNEERGKIESEYNDAVVKEAMSETLGEDPSAARKLENMKKALDELDKKIARLTDRINLMERGMPGTEMYETTKKEISDWVKKIVEPMNNRLGVKMAAAPDTGIAGATHEDATASPSRKVVPEGVRPNVTSREAMDSMRFETYVDIAETWIKAVIQVNEGIDNRARFSWISPSKAHLEVKGFLGNEMRFEIFKNKEGELKFTMDSPVMGIYMDREDIHDQAIKACRFFLEGFRSKYGPDFNAVLFVRFDDLASLLGLEDRKTDLETVAGLNLVNDKYEAPDLASAEVGLHVSTSERFHMTDEQLKAFRAEISARIKEGKQMTIPDAIKYLKGKEVPDNSPLMTSLETAKTKDLTSDEEINNLMVGLSEGEEAALAILIQPGQGMGYGASGFEVSENDVLSALSPGDLAPPLLPDGTLNIDNLYLVHLTEDFPRDGYIYPTSFYVSAPDGTEPRAAWETIHFSINSTVLGNSPESHGPDFFNRKYMVIVPMKGVEDQISLISPMDTAARGVVKLPKGSIVVGRRLFVPDERSIDEEDIKVRTLDNDDPRSMQQILHDILVQRGATPMNFDHRNIEDHKDARGGWFDDNGKDWNNQIAFERFVKEREGDLVVYGNSQDTNVSHLRQRIGKVFEYYLNEEADKVFYDGGIREIIDLSRAEGLEMMLELINSALSLEELAHCDHKNRLLRDSYNRLNLIAHQAIALLERDLEITREGRPAVLEKEQVVSLIRKVAEDFGGEDNYFISKPESYDYIGEIIMPKLLSQNAQERRKGLDLLKMSVKHERSRFDPLRPDIVRFLMSGNVSADEMIEMTEVINEYLSVVGEKMIGNWSKRMSIIPIWETFDSMLARYTGDTRREILRYFLSLDHQYRWLVTPSNQHLITKDRGKELYAEYLRGGQEGLGMTVFEHLKFIFMLFEIGSIDEATAKKEIEQLDFATLPKMDSFDLSFSAFKRSIERILGRSIEEKYDADARARPMEGVSAPPSELEAQQETRKVFWEDSSLREITKELRRLADNVTINYTEENFKEDVGVIIGRYEENAYIVTQLIPLPLAPGSTPLNPVVDKEDIKHIIDTRIEKGKEQVMGIYHNHPYLRLLQGQKPGPSSGDILDEYLDIPGYEEHTLKGKAPALGLVLEPVVSENLSISEVVNVDPGKLSVVIHSYLTPEGAKVGEFENMLVLPMPDAEADASRGSLIGKVTDADGRVLTDGFTAGELSKDGKKVLFVAHDELKEDIELGLGEEIEDVNSVKAAVSGLLKRAKFLNAGYDAELKRLMEKKLLNIMRIVTLEPNEKVMGFFAGEVLYLSRDLLSNEMALIHELGESLAGEDFMAGLLAEYTEMNMHTYMRGAGKDVHAAYSALGDRVKDVTDPEELIEVLNEEMAKGRTKRTEMSKAEKALVRFNASQHHEGIEGAGSRRLLFGFQDRLDPAGSIRLSKHIRYLLEDMNRGVHNTFIIPRGPVESRSAQQSGGNGAARRLERRYGTNTTILRFDDHDEGDLKKQIRNAIETHGRENYFLHKVKVSCQSEAQRKEIVKYILDEHEEYKDLFVVTYEESKGHPIDEVKTIMVGSALLNDHRLSVDLGLTKEELSESRRSMITAFDVSGVITLTDSDKDKLGTPEGLDAIMWEIYEGKRPLRINPIDWNELRDFHDSMQLILQSV